MKSFIIGLLIWYLPEAVWSQEINVVVTFSVLADMVQEVGGNQVKVRMLVGSNGDPHVYEPTPTDSAALAHAELVFVSGLGLEGWMDRLISASGYHGKVVVASNGVETHTLIDHVRENGVKSRNVITTDPHAWTSAANGVIYATNIQAALIAADPAHTAQYQISGDRYLAELRKLDAWARHEIETIPMDKRKIITSHQSFGYLGNAYGIEFRAPIGFSTESEPSAQQVAALIDQIRREQIKAVFIENATDARLVKLVARETGARPGGVLYAEALSKENGPASSYIKMIQYNIKIMKAGMQGDNQ
ncbi:zinc/manganese transport system substrate-binding protein [Gammaproteobacteria bacterium]